MAPSKPRARRARGNVSWLPSGAERVTVYGGIDQLTGKRIQLRETVAARETQRETEKEAEKVRIKLAAAGRGAVAENEPAASD
jgi:integrase